MAPKPPMRGSLSKKMPLRDQEAVERQKIVEWRERFKMMRFYFDGVDPKKLGAITAKIKYLNGKVERFLSRAVTHVVTGNPEAVDMSKTTDISSLRGPDIIEITRFIDSSLWTESRLERVLDLIYDPNALSEALRREKMNVGNKISQRGFKDFKGYYILVEEPSGAYRPIVMKEFEQPDDPAEPPWPVIRYLNRSNHTAFAAPSVRDVDFKQVSSQDMDQENNNNEVTVEQAASGFFSGSVAQAAMRDIAENPVLAKISIRSVMKRDRETEFEELERVKRKKTYHVYPMILQKGGFCENCNTKYDNYDAHLNSTKHRKYATNPNNFLPLEPLINSLSRKLIPVKVMPIELDINSDDTISLLPSPSVSVAPLMITAATIESVVEDETIQDQSVPIAEHVESEEPLDDLVETLLSVVTLQVHPTIPDIESRTIATSEVELVATLVSIKETSITLSPIEEVKDVLVDEELLYEVDRVKYDIEGITDKRTVTGGRETCEYLVSWIGYPGVPTWEGYYDGDPNWTDDLSHVLKFEANRSLIIKLHLRKPQSSEVVIQEPEIVGNNDNEQPCEAVEKLAVKDMAIDDEISGSDLTDIEMLGPIIPESEIYDFDSSDNQYAGLRELLELEGIKKLVSESDSDSLLPQENITIATLEGPKTVTVEAKGIRKEEVESEIFEHVHHITPNKLNDGKPVDITASDDEESELTDLANLNVKELSPRKELELQAAKQAIKVYSRENIPTRVSSPLSRRTTPVRIAISKKVQVQSSSIRPVARRRVTSTAVPIGLDGYPVPPTVTRKAGIKTRIERIRDGRGVPIVIASSSPSR